MKVFFRNIHLYLSLAAGIIIFGSCLTGTVLVFEKEIDHALHPERYYVKPQGARLPLSQLKAMALKQMPKAKPASIMVYNDAERTVEFGVIVPEKKGKGNKDKQLAKPEEDKKGRGGDIKDKKPKEAERANLVLFLNPYTGELVGQYSRRQSFLFSVEMYHRFLLAGKDSAGDLIVGIATLLFLFILITGVILWWPKTKNIMRQRLKIKWDGSTKRLTHDLHLVTGFYTSVFLIITVTTGLIMSFKWANKALYAVTSSVIQTEQPKPPKSVYQAGAKPLTIDEALKGLSGKINIAAFYTIRTPKDSTGTFSINILPQGAIESTADTYFIDQYSGDLAGSQLFADKSLGQRARALVKPIHTGAVYGLPTKVISFIVCLLSLIFPVTGVMMWLNRIKKKKPDAKRLVRHKHVLQA
ncbi:PepSY-associated TM helix domain-containing protein [Mucilaginibacter aquariorum]|uniref:PepSY domain-containing protein n=1 Tax=Mucilaginibacter aquariorum TaxID=2967225 RepID=A0ABT1T4M7_9SPHI|nr:PepSY-associated TM helix domain-containing protein [Mucilaginibacter aquariorum]MCQ6959524.1 PepSY domain-containing protein [Mucilaginibacter aquariorum]